VLGSLSAHVFDTIEIHVCEARADDAVARSVSKRELRGQREGCCVKSFGVRLLEPQTSGTDLSEFGVGVVHSFDSEPPQVIAVSP
jgi:hypothetical protein